MNCTPVWDLLKVQRKVRKASEAAVEANRMTCWLDDTRWFMPPAQFAYHHLAEEVLYGLVDEEYFHLHFPVNAYTYLGPYYFTDPERAEETRELEKQRQLETES